MTMGEGANTFIMLLKYRDIILVSEITPMLGGYTSKPM